MRSRGSSIRGPGPHYGDRERGLGKFCGSLEVYVSRSATVSAETEPTATEHKAASAFDDLLVEARVRGREIEQRGSIPPDLLRSLKASGIYRAAVPQRFGGDERPLVEVLRTIETISAADGSLGWVASFAPQGANYLAGLSAQRLQEIYSRSPDVIGAGGLFPLQAAQRVEGGLRIDGRWKFASGCTGADWLCVGIFVDGEPGGERSSPLPRMACLPADRVSIVENWDVMGLAGTGSHDLVVRDQVITEDWTFIRGGGSPHPEPICRFPSQALAAAAFAVVGLGVARGAMQELIALAGGKVSITGGGRLGERNYVQLEIGKAEATLRSARAFLYEQVQAVWEGVAQQSGAAASDVNLLRLAACHAARTGAQIAHVAFSLAGTTAIYKEHPLQRRLRDAQVVAQHAFLSEGHFESGGRHVLGMPTPPGYP